MIIETKGDILERPAPWSVILHQVNCFGIAAGLAKQIRGAFPGWYAEYRNHCDQTVRKEDLLGTIHSYEANAELIICSAFAQFGISKTDVATDYGAWDKILRRLEIQIVAKNLKDRLNWTLHVPYGIGCGLGGGDWKRMRDMFEFYFGHSDAKLFIHRL